MSAATAFYDCGVCGFEEIPNTPFSRTWRASYPPRERSLRPRRSCPTARAGASSGMTVQSLVVTMTIRFLPFCAASFSLALSVIVHSITSLPGDPVAVRCDGCYPAGLLTSPARSATTASAPLSMAVVTISLFQQGGIHPELLHLLLLQRFLRVDVVVDNAADRLDKGPGIVALEGVPPHADPSTPGCDQFRDHLQRFKVAALHQPGDKDRHRAGFHKYGQRPRHFPGNSSVCVRRWLLSATLTHCPMVWGSLPGHSSPSTGSTTIVESGSFFVNTFHSNRFYPSASNNTGFRGRFFQKAS